MTRCSSQPLSTEGLHRWLDCGTTCRTFLCSLVIEISTISALDFCGHQAFNDLLFINGLSGRISRSSELVTGQIAEMARHALNLAHASVTPFSHSPDRLILEMEPCIRVVFGERGLCPSPGTFMFPTRKRAKQVSSPSSLDAHT
jgi:hypothetical protein